MPGNRCTGSLRLLVRSFFLYCRRCNDNMVTVNKFLAFGLTEITDGSLNIKVKSILSN